MALEVVDQRRGLVAEVTEVDGLAALAQEEQAIEDFEQLGRGLMDTRKGKSSEHSHTHLTLNHVRADNRLASIRKAAEETHDGPSTL